MTIDKNQTIWAEKYRPTKIEDLVLPEMYLKKFKEFIESPSNILLSSVTPGTGKTSTVNALIKQGEFESIFINASLENGVDTLRSKIIHFASTEALNNKKKIAVLDECLDENEEVVILSDGDECSIRLKNLDIDKIYDCLSLNLETMKIERDTCQVISRKEDELYEVTLEDSRTITATSNHPFIVFHSPEYVNELSIDDGLEVGHMVACRFLGTGVPITIKSIKPKGKGRVINLLVHKNHTFITKNGIITHNCDNMTDASQKAIRGIIEETARNCSFILTCNYINNIIPAVQNRFEIYNFDEIHQSHKQELVKITFNFLKEILINEEIEFNQEDLVDIIKNYYPSIRGMVACLQKSVFDKKLRLDIQKDTHFDELLENIRKKDFQKTMKIIYSLSNADKFYEYAFRKVEVPSQNRPQFLILLAKYQYQASFARDKNLNLAACIMEIAPLL